MTELKIHKKQRQDVPKNPAPTRLTQVFAEPIISWRRFSSAPLDASYYVVLASGSEQVLHINQRAKDEPKVGRAVVARQLLKGFTTEIICADTTCTRLDYPYFVTAYNPTPTLRHVWPGLDAEGKAHAARAWGEAVRFIHRVRFSLAGDLAYSEAQGVKLADDLDMLWQKPLQLALKDYMLDGPRLIKALHASKDVCQDAPVVLVHVNPKYGSFLYNEQEKRVVAALDFEDARRGDPMMDVARVAPQLELLGVKDDFLHGYGALSKWELERLNIFTLHHLLLDYASALTDFPNQIASNRLKIADWLTRNKQLI